MRDEFTPAVKAVQDRPLDRAIVVWVVQARVPPAGENPGSPLRVQEVFGEGTVFDVVKYASSFDASTVSPGDQVLLIGLKNRRWVAMGTVE